MERLRRAKLVLRRAKKMWSANKGGLLPEMLVALTAISYAFPQAIGCVSLEQYDFDRGYKEAGEVNRDEADAIYGLAWKRHTSRFTTQWPPTQQQMEMFRKSVVTMRDY